MSIQFSSLEMIMDRFGIEEESIVALRSKLRSMQAKYHPDKNGGSFADEDSEKIYRELDEAVSFIDGMSKSNFNLETISVVTDLTKAVTALVAAQENKVSSKETLLSSEINRSIESYSEKIKAPRITLGALTVAMSAIWIFPNTVNEHPVLRNFINFESKTMNLLWVYMLLNVAIFWFLTWRKEELNKARQESLKTESVQNRLFTNFINKFNNDSFTLEEFVAFLMNQNRRYKSPFFLINGSSQIDSPLAHATAEVILERALKRNILKSYNSGSISTIYQVVSSNKASK